MTRYDWTRLQPQTVTLGGAELILRPLRKSDESALGDYFTGLSERTRRVYGPHRFDRDTAAAICRDMDTPEGNAHLRLVAVAGGTIVGYFILCLFLRPPDQNRRYAFLNPDLTCTLAPSVADAWQDKGLGSRLMAYTLEAARVFGKKTMVLWGGVRAENVRAVHFYTKFGFRTCGEFIVTQKPEGQAPVVIDNYDMLAEL